LLSQKFFLTEEHTILALFELLNGGGENYLSLTVTFNAQPLAMELARNQRRQKNADKRLVQFQLNFTAGIFIALL